MNTSMHFGHVFLTRLYGLAWGLARPFLKRHKRLADGFERRLVPPDWAEPADLWMQAASGGEAYLVWEILAALPAVSADTSAAAPGVRVLVTTWTRQGLEVLQGMAATLRESRPDLHIQVTLFPLDHPTLMYRAVGMVRPRAVVLLETELWPGLLFACARRHVPVLVLNGRLSPKSLRNYTLMNTLAPGFWTVAGPAVVCAMSPADAARFTAVLPPERVSHAPNIKFDRALTHAPDSESLCTLGRLLPAETPVILFASVRQEEERFLIPVIRHLAKQHPQAVIIVAPRHMHRTDPWFDALSSHSLRLRSLLTPELPARAGQVVIWNVFGELSALYALSAAVFIGGSLAPLGGQNFLEALACGRVPHTGPHLQNFLWALDPGTGSQSLEAQQLIRRCPDAEALAETLHRTLGHPDDPSDIRQRFTHWLQARKGGAQHCAELLAAYLSPDSSPSKPLSE